MRRVLPLAATLIAAVIVAAPAAGAPPSVGARAWIVVDPATGEVLASRNPDLRLPMASTTKIMTAIVAMDRAALDTVVVVPPEASTPGGSSANLVAGERISVRNLLRGLMVGSGNDAAIALATSVGGGQSRFVALMNARARAMGLRNTRFANPHGLDAPGHYSTVRDLVALGRLAREEYPFLKGVVRNRVITIPGPNGAGTRRLESENDLLALDPTADGVKTGHTAGAGYSLVAHATRPARGKHLYVALIGSSSRPQRARDAKRLLDWGFAQFGRVTPLPAGRTVVTVPVRDRPGVTARLVAERPLSVTVRLGDRLRRTIVAPAEITGPVARGTAVGTVQITRGEDVLGSRRLVVAEDVAGPGVLERVRSAVGRVL